MQHARRKSCGGRFRYLAIEELGPKVNECAAYGKQNCKTNEERHAPVTKVVEIHVKTSFHFWPLCIELSPANIVRIKSTLSKFLAVRTCERMFV